MPRCALDRSRPGWSVVVSPKMDGFENISNGQLVVAGTFLFAINGAIAFFLKQKLGKKAEPNGEGSLRPLQGKKPDSD